jgi:RNA polymerase sigma-B factor
MKAVEETPAKDHNLMRLIKSGDDPGAMEQLFRDYEDFLRLFAHKYQSSMLPYEDAYQVAALGLLKALQRYDPERGTAFTTFAYPTVAGELKKYYRDHVEIVRIPRRIRDLRRAILTAQEAFRECYRREPTVNEMAGILDVSQEDVIEALATVRISYMLSLDIPFQNESGDDPLASFLGYQDAGFEHMEAKMILDEVMSTLPYDLRKILEMKLAGWTQKNIAEDLGISQMEVSRLQRKAIQMVNEFYALQKEPA